MGAQHALRAAVARFPVTVPDPSTITNLIRWYKPSTLAALADNDPVASWPDSSSAGIPATQATGTKQPLKKTGIVNGKPVVRFDGTDDWLTSATIVQAQPITIFCVGKYRGARIGNDTLYGTSSNALRFFRSNTTELSLFSGSAIACAKTVSDLATVFHAYYALFSGAGSELRVDGGAAATGSPGTIGLATAAMNLGAQGSGLEVGPVDIAEFIMYSRALTTPERQTVETYLRSEYGTP